MLYYLSLRFVRRKRTPQMDRECHRASEQPLLQGEHRKEAEQPLSNQQLQHFQQVFSLTLLYCFLGSFHI